jgi:bifunctional ADP-heptose synthase (sugar kinase/adenylyltransferase)
VRESRIVSVSIYGPGMDAMIDLARRYGKPLAVADISGPHDSRLPGAAIVTTSRSVLRLKHDVHDVEPWMRAVHESSGALVVVSDGPRPALAMTHDGRLLSANPPAIDPVDTTGAGDALKAGMIYGWLHNWPIEQTLRWAIAAASLQCLRHGACEDVPAAAEIEALMPGVTIHHGDTETRSA